VTFDDFVALNIRLRYLTDQFRRRDTSGAGSAQMFYDDFLQIVMRV
jgi:hypothetical protein